MDAYVLEKYLTLNQSNIMAFASLPCLMKTPSLLSSNTRPLQSLTHCPLPMITGDMDAFLVATRRNFLKQYHIYPRYLAQKILASEVVIWDSDDP